MDDIDDEIDEKKQKSKFDALGEYEKIQLKLTKYFNPKRKRTIETFKFHQARKLVSQLNIM